MIQPIITANQAIANKTMTSTPYFAGKTQKAQKANTARLQDNIVSQNYKASMLKNMSQKGEKLDINCEGCRIHTLNGNKINYFA